MSYAPEYASSDETGTSTKEAQTAIEDGAEDREDLGPREEPGDTSEKPANSSLTEYKEAWKRLSPRSRRVAGALAAGAVAGIVGLGSLISGGEEEQAAQPPTETAQNDDDPNLEQGEATREYEEWLQNQTQETENTSTIAGIELITGNRYIDEHLFENKGIIEFSEFKEKWEDEVSDIHTAPETASSKYYALDFMNVVNDDFKDRVDSVKSGEGHPEKENGILNGLTLVFTDGDSRTFVLENPPVYGYKMVDREPKWNEAVYEHKNFVLFFSDGDTLHNINYLHDDGVNDGGVFLSTYGEETGSELKLRAAFVEEDGANVENAQLDVQEVNDETRVNFELPNGGSTEFTDSSTDSSYEEVIEELSENPNFYPASLRVINDINT